MSKNNYIEEVLLIVNAAALLAYLDFRNMDLRHFGMYTFTGNLLTIMPSIFLLLAGGIFYMKNIHKRKN